jgi:ketosteroid isomerase-like protein
VSQQNVKMLREAVDAYSRGDVEAFLKTAHPDVDWYPFTAQAEGGGAYHGHEGVRRWWSNLVSIWTTSRRASASVGTWEMR